MKWIKVEDRLPDNFGDVLFNTIDRKGIDACKVGFYDGEWCDSDENPIKGYKNYLHVTHWAEIEPPE